MLRTCRTSLRSSAVATRLSSINIFSRCNYASRARSPATSRANIERQKIQNRADSAAIAEAKLRNEQEKKAALLKRATSAASKTRGSSTNKAELRSSSKEDELDEEESFSAPRRPPLVAIVGRPNVGKSTLFNRIVGRSQSLISPVPGTTRDRVYGLSDWTGRSFLVVDTGGVMGNKKDFFSPRIQEQAMLAVKEADVILFMVDTIEGLTHEDKMLASLLRKKGGDLNRTILVLANKADNFERKEMTEQFKSLGLPVLPISASHGLGMSDLLSAIGERLPEQEEEEEEDTPVDDAKQKEDGEVTKPKSNPLYTKPVRIAIVGRPNVGKSSLLNRILGFERSIVSAIAGTTHDPVDQTILWRQKRPVTLIDTAGITQRGRHKKGVDSTSILWAIKVISRADVVCLLLDGEVGPLEEDQRVASYIQDSLRSAVIVLNKADLLPSKSRKAMVAYEQGIRNSLKFMDYVPIVKTSALKGMKEGEEETTNAIQ